MKKCKRCLEVKPFSEFYGQSRNKDGLRPYCKLCDKAQYKKYSEANKEKIKEYGKEYYQDNKLVLKIKRLG